MIGRLEGAIENEWLLFMTTALAPSGSLKKKNHFKRGYQQVMDYQSNTFKPCKRATRAACRKKDEASRHQSLPSQPLSLTDTRTVNQALKSTGVNSRPLLPPNGKLNSSFTSNAGTQRVSNLRLSQWYVDTSKCSHAVDLPHQEELKTLEVSLEETETELRHSFWWRASDSRKLSTSVMKQ